MSKFSDNSVKLDFLGQQISLKSAASAEVINDVVALAEKKIREAESRVTGKVPHHIALLALLDVAEEYMHAKKRTTKHNSEVRAKYKKLERVLAASLNENSESIISSLESLEPAEVVESELSELSEHSTPHLNKGPSASQPQV